MKKLLLAALFALATPSLAAEPVTVHTRVISARSLRSSEGKLTQVRVRLVTCGGARCDGQLKIVVPSPKFRLRKNGALDLSVDPEVAASMSRLKRGGPLQRLSLRGEAPSGSPSNGTALGGSR